MRPDTLPDRLFQSKVADVFRGLPVDVVQEMLESIVAQDMSVLEETILTVCGYLRQKLVVVLHVDEAADTSTRVLAKGRVGGVHVHQDLKTVLTAKSPPSCPDRASPCPLGSQRSGRRLSTIQRCFILPPCSLGAGGLELGP